MKEKLDRRVIKTRKEIKEALVRLLINNDINKISITMLTNECDINRATFYLHYNSIYDVLDEIENDIIYTVTEVAPKLSLKDLKENPFPLLDTLHAQINNYPDFSRFLVSSKSGAQLIDKLRPIFTDYLINEYIKVANTDNEEIRRSIKHACIYTTGGSLEVFKNWYLDQNEKESLEEVCKEVSEYIANGISKTLDKLMQNIK